MPDLPYHPDDCICALATPLAESALAVIRLSGPETLVRLAPLFSSRKGLDQAEGHSVLYGKLVDPESRRILDEVMLTVFRGPRSYTGQDSAEITCHGSLPVIRNLLDLLTDRGFRPASPGEFTFRAYLNGKLDLTEAEAVQELISARSGAAGDLALDRLLGSVYREIERFKAETLKFAAWVELHLDYPEDEIEAPPFQTDDLDRLIGSMETLRGSYRIGRLYRDGIKMVLVGRTNAGKSSLFNLLLREERSIVSDLHGTTRDYLESAISLAGVPVTLYDTAGLREGENPVENEGIRRSRQLIDRGDIILYLVDGAEGLDARDTEFRDRYREDPRVIYVWNKCDSARCLSPPQGWIPVSALTGKGFEVLEKKLEHVIFSGERRPSDGRPVIDSDRQNSLLGHALEGLKRFRDGFVAGAPLDLLSEDLHQTLTALGELTGEITPEDILDTLFSSFCVGK